MKAVFAALLLAFFVTTADAMHDFDAWVYAVPYDTRKTVAWTAPDPAFGTPDGYEYSVFQMESAKTVLTGTSLTAAITIRFRTHGHYILYVRPYKTVNGVKAYGPWGNSLDPTVGTVNGKPHAWVVYVLQQ